MLGLGIGWLQEEFAAIGVPFARRGKRSDEYLAALKAVWTGQEVDFQGEFVRWQGFQMRPAPAQAGGCAAGHWRGERARHPTHRAPRRRLVCDRQGSGRVPGTYASGWTTSVAVRVAIGPNSKSPPTGTTTAQGADSLSAYQELGGGPSVDQRPGSAPRQHRRGPGTVCR